jgi:hypothetical protein
MLVIFITFKLSFHFNDAYGHCKVIPLKFLLIDMFKVLIFLCRKLITLCIGPAV